MQVIIIAAVAKNRAIGFQGKLLYWLPNDLKRFKSLTTNHTIIMGRKTFESLPKGALPLRRNIVLSKEERNFPSCECFSSLKDALKACESEEKVYIIGGESLYRQSIGIADKLCLTLIDDTPKEADTFFPKYDDWKEVKKEEFSQDEKHAYSYSFIDYER